MIFFMWIQTAIATLNFVDKILPFTLIFVKRNVSMINSSSEPLCLKAQGFTIKDLNGLEHCIYLVLKNVRTK